MKPFQLFYTDVFVLPLPAGHRFPMQKYSRLRETLASGPDRDRITLAIPPAATDTELLRVHTAEYLERATQGHFTREDVKRLGFPWSTELIERSRRSSGATIAAARAALRDGFSANLAGGTHHAYADRAEGFCVFNDSVVAARALQAEGLVQRVAVIDLDVHQGNGTAVLCVDDPSIYTFSMHSARNYPFVKERSDWDIELPDETGDAVYLALLNEALPQIFAIQQPEIVIYLAGADPYVGDRLGRLALTADGLAERDRLVFRACRARGVPVAVSMAGGYAPNIEEIVAIHARTIHTGMSLYGESTSPGEQ